LIRLIPNIYNIIATKNHVTLESQIADHDFLNQILDASRRFFHQFNSSLILSNINILASIAIQIDNIRPAIEASVKVTSKDLIIAKIKHIYMNNDNEAINQEVLYSNNKNAKIIKNQITQDIINFSSEETHNFESIVFSEVKYIGAGTTHVFILLANILASSGV
jgi:hypothetical protein